MPVAAADCFPLQYALDQSESLRRFLGGRGPDQVAPTLDAVVRAAVQLGEQLPDAWRRAFRALGAPAEGWMTVGQYEEQRDAVRRLFAAVRGAMDDARRAAEAAPAGRTPAELPRLLALVEEARRQEEAVFRDWISFRDPLPPTDFSKAMPVEDAFAEMMGVTVEQFREKVAEHKQRYHGGNGEAKA